MERRSYTVKRLTIVLTQFTSMTDGVKDRLTDRQMDGQNCRNGTYTAFRYNASRAETVLNFKFLRTAYLGIQCILKSNSRCGLNCRRIYIAYSKLFQHINIMSEAYDSWCPFGTATDNENTQSEVDHG